MGEVPMSPKIIPKVIRTPAAERAWCLLSDDMYVFLLFSCNYVNTNVYSTMNMYVGKT